MKTGWKKFAIWALVIATLLGTVIGSQAMAIKTSDALEKMKEAGKIQLVANVFSKCMTKEIDMGLTNILYDYPGLENIFMNTNWTNTEIPTGAWLEYQVQGKVNNGTIYCDDNDSKIFDVFVSTMGISQEEVLCNSEKPGIVKLQTQDSDGKWKDVTNYCASGLGNSDYQFVWNDKDEALKHLKKLYDAKKKNNDYMVAWGDRGTFSDDLINYFLYFNDFATACSTSEPFSGDESLMNKTKYYGPIKVPNPSTGKMDERYYSKGGASKYGDWDSNWINNKGAHTCDAVITRLNETAPAVKKALDKTEKDDDGTKPDDVVGDITDEANQNKNESEDGTICSKAAGSLGWIMCSVIQGVGNSVSSIYDMIEEDFLRTDASFVARTEIKEDKEVETPTYKIWKKFQGFANIAFIIALLVIILSQITGFGVSNYGIKKTLPSLIMVAILVNLSFFICQIAVDLSNILGGELRTRFLDFASEITIDSDFKDGSAGSIVGYIVDTVTGPSLVGIGVILFRNFNAWIWPFLLSLLGVAVGVLFFFLILGIRQAGIIILIVLSPLAMICYALPNTKSLFDRWRKLLTSLLVAYPICGLLMGGGQFVGKLLLANIYSGDTSGNMSSILFFGAVDSGISNFFYVLIAMLIQVVPFFFIPSIVKSSMAAMGNLGMKLSNFGRGLSRSATGTIRKSDGYKDRVARGRARDASRAIKRAGKTTGVQGLMNRAGEKYRSSNLLGAKTAAKSYTRRQAGWINAVAAQQDAERRAQMTVAGGLAGAERRQNEELRKFHESTYKGDRAFMSDFDAQEAEYENALDAVDRNPTDETAVARLRALQDVIGSTPDGQDRIQRVLNRRLYAEQEAARVARRPAVLSAGMQAAKETLMSDHGGFKSGNRGLAATLKDMNANGDVFKNGTFAQTGTDAKGDAIYSNAHYGAQAAKGSAYELANANDDTLQNMYDSIGSMSYQQLMDTYRNASEAITNDTIAIKPENEAMLNKIRQEAWNQIQASTAGSPDYYDDQGRRFEHNVGSFYNYTDNNGTVHRYKRDASTGDFKEMGGAGEVISSGQMMSASDNFISQYGSNYRELHAGDTYKIDHRQYAYATMPTGWHQRKDGNWYNGNTRLTPDEVARAEEIRRYNNQVDIHNGT